MKGVDGNVAWVRLQVHLNNGHIGHVVIRIATRVDPAIQAKISSTNWTSSSPNIDFDPSVGASTTVSLKSSADAGDIAKHTITAGNSGKSANVALYVVKVNMIIDGKSEQEEVYPGDGAVICKDDILHPFTVDVQPKSTLPDGTVELSNLGGLLEIYTGGATVPATSWPLSSVPSSLSYKTIKGGTTTVKLAYNAPGSSGTFTDEVDLTVVEVTLDSLTPTSICTASSALAQATVIPAGRPLEWTLMDNTIGASFQDGTMTKPSITGNSTSVNVMAGNQGGTVIVAVADATLHCYPATKELTIVDVEFLSLSPTTICTASTALATAKVTPSGRDLTWTLIDNAIGSSFQNGAATSLAVIDLFAPPVIELNAPL